MSASRREFLKVIAAGALVLIVSGCGVEWFPGDSASTVGLFVSCVEVGDGTFTVTTSREGVKETYHTSAAFAPSSGDVVKLETVLDGDGKPLGARLVSGDDSVLVLDGPHPAGV